MERRLLTWQKGDLEALLREGRAIQGDFMKSKHHQGSDEAVTSRSFANLVHHGRIRAALRLLDSHTRGGVLGLDDRVRTVPGFLEIPGKVLEFPPSWKNPGNMLKFLKIPEMYSIVAVDRPVLL